MHAVEARRAGLVIEQKDADFIEETIAVLEHVSELETLKDEELDVIGELISNHIII